MRFSVSLVSSLGATALLAVGCADAASTGAPAQHAASKKADAGQTAKQMKDGGLVTIQYDAEIPASVDEGLVSSYLADAGDGWQSLIQAHWRMEPGTEGYRCARMTVAEDTAIHEFRTLSPLGTHHTVLTVSRDPSMPDGLTECSAAANSPGGLFGSGVGTNDFTLPDGVAVVLHAGDQLTINMHLFNISDKAIEGTSGTLVRTMAQPDAAHVAEGVLAGTINLDIPPGPGSVQTGHCTMVQDVTLIAVLPHMHQHGVHLKALAHSSIDGDVMLHDADYSFDAQLVYPIDPVQMKAGDQVEVDCTYDNPTTSTIHFGESTLDEMCFAGVWRYPAPENPSFFCVK